MFALIRIKIQGNDDRLLESIEYKRVLHVPYYVYVACIVHSTYPQPHFVVSVMPSLVHNASQTST